MPVGGDRGTGDWHEIDDFAHTRLGEKASDEDGGVRVVELVPGECVDSWSTAQVSTAIIVQQRAEDTGRVEAGRAEPIDCAIGADECRRL